MLNTRWTLLLNGGLIILVCSAFEVEAALVTLAWNPSSSPNIAGYRLYSGTTSGVYTQTIQVGNATSTLISNLVTGKTYFFAVTAYNTMGVESAPSNQVSYLVPSSSPTPTPTPSATPTPTPTPSPTPTPKPSPTPTPSATPIPTPTPAPTPTPTPPSTGPAQMLSPPPGSTFSSSTVTFRWSAGSATAYYIFVGSSLHGTDILQFWPSANVLSATVNNVPTDGRTIYVTLGSFINGSWTANYYTYRATAF